eukprot:IDg20506t1
MPRRLFIRWEHTFIECSCDFPDNIENIDRQQARGEFPRRTLDRTQDHLPRNTDRVRQLRAELENPRYRGSGRYVALGVYTSGRHNGKRCVIKWNRHKIFPLGSSFRYDMKAVRKAEYIIRAWNSSQITPRRMIINIPVVSRLAADAGRFAGTKVFTEPYISHFVKWNSKTGRLLRKQPYHFKPRNMLKRGSYGDRDLGMEGIYTFFAHHSCNEYCQSRWRKPRHARRCFSVKKSTVSRSTL